MGLRFESRQVHFKQPIHTELEHPALRRSATWPDYAASGVTDEDFTRLLVLQHELSGVDFKSPALAARRRSSLGGAGSPGHGQPTRRRTYCLGLKGRPLAASWNL